MSPEALDDPPVYTMKLDSFSFGVLGIQIITRKFPDPGPRMKKVQDPHDPKRLLHEVVYMKLNVASHTFRHKKVVVSPPRVPYEDFLLSQLSKVM